MPKHEGEDELHDALLDGFHDHMDDIDLDELELAVADHDLQSVERALQLDRASKTMTAILAALLMAVFMASGRKAAERAKIDFNALDDQYIAWLQGRVTTTVGGVANHAYDVARNVFLRGVRGNLSPREIARQLRFALFLTDRNASAIDRALQAMVYTNVPVRLMGARLRALFAGYLDHRARIIAATEITATTAAAILLVQRQAERDAFEAGSRKRWVTALDEMVCPVCRPLHNVTVDLNGLFPGGLDAPPAHPLCRCHVEIVTRSPK